MIGSLLKYVRGAVNLIGGNSPYYAVDVELQAGKKRILTDATVTVEQLLGKDPIPDTYFEIVNTGAQGNTWRIQIAATPNNDPTSPDRDAPAVDYTYTVLVGDVGDEIKLRDNIISALNADTNFKASLKAQKVKDLAIIHITSLFRGEFYERPNALDFNVTVNGTASVVIGYDNIIMRGKATALARDPNYPHQLGTLNISGQVESISSEIGNIFEANALNAGSPALNVNGSVAPVVFSINAVADYDIYITKLIFYGYASGIKFGQFLNINVVLTNGIGIQIKSDDAITNLLNIHETGDFQSEFGLTEFQLLVGAGPDSFKSIVEFTAPFPLRKIGTFASNDYINVTINDNLSTIGKLQFLATGYKQEA